MQMKKLILGLCRFCNHSHDRKNRRRHKVADFLGEFHAIDVALYKA